MVLNTEHRSTAGSFQQIHSLQCANVLTAKSACFYESQISGVVRSLFHGYSGAVIVTGDVTAKYALTGMASTKAVEKGGAFTFFPNIVPKALAEILAGAKECMDLESYSARQRGRTLRGTFFRLSFQAFQPSANNQVYDLQERKRSKTPPPSRSLTTAALVRRSPSPLNADRPSAPTNPGSAAQPRGGTAVGLELSWDIHPGADLQKIEDSLINHLDRVSRARSAGHRFSIVPD